jgi:hypothetical protein
MRPGHAIDDEARRVADKQLRLAIAGLGTAASTEGNRRIHTARRHVKKVRALMHLVEPRLHAGSRHRQRRLRTASRLLAAIADSEALVDTFEGLARRYPGAIGPATEAELRAALQAREGQARRVADFGGVLRKVAALLAAEQTRVRTWQLDEEGCDAIARGMRRSVRRGRRAMRRALVRPTTRRYTVWRRRVKELWLQMRLVEGYTGGRLRQEQQFLERLDGVLGETHNCALLCDALVAGALGSRQDTARCLRLVRRYRSDLRGEATTLAPLVHGTPPRDFVKRIEHVWLRPDAASTPSRTATGLPPAKRNDSDGLFHTDQRRHPASQEATHERVGGRLQRAGVSSEGDTAIAQHDEIGLLRLA